ncbi:MAG: hypothetical protein DRZ82_05535 [Thermoprotei archaeon]|nr:MAG: hypothetical protein DRZ82_05535 [Thermoprotei archaeon]
MKVIFWYGGPLALYYAISKAFSKLDSGDWYILVIGRAIVLKRFFKDRITLKEEGEIYVPRIDYTKCNACGLCISHCPVDAIVGLPGAKPTLLIDRCMLCFQCVDTCPEKAIRRVGKKAYRVFVAHIDDKRFLCISLAHWNVDPIIKCEILRKAIERCLKEYRIGMILSPLIEKDLTKYLRTISNDVEYILLDKLSSIRISGNVTYVADKIKLTKEFIDKVYNTTEDIIREFIHVS